MNTDGRRRWRLVRARSDAIPASLRRLMARATRPRLGTVPWGLLGLAVAVFVFLGWLVFASPVLGVRKVQVDGLILLEEFQVREAAGVVMGTPLPRVDTGSVTERVAALAPVASVDVTRVWPSTLRIEVVERVPVGAVKADDQLHVFDDQGVIFRTADSPPPDAVVVEIKSGDPARLVIQALKVIQALTPELKSELVTLTIDGPAGITLVLQKDRMVTWGDAEDSDLKARAATALLKQKGNRIDVSVPEIVTIQ